MIGEKVIIRTRMSLGDAHYAGNLVNGSKMLEFFGDVATELLVRRDGDEGLFRTYEHVDFLAPVYAGDIIEYQGWIEEEGNSSRKMKFEAYKVLSPTLTPGLEVSAVDVLDPPILVGRAEGICVVPKKNQRGPQDPRFSR